MANGLTIQQLPDSLSPSDARQIDFGFQLKKADLKIDRLGSGLVDHSQKMTVAARATAEKKAVGQRS